MNEDIQKKEEELALTNNEVHVIILFPGMSNHLEIYIENITCLRVDMYSILECSTRYLIRLLRSLVRYQVFFFRWNAILFTRTLTLLTILLILTLFIQALLTS